MDVRILIVSPDPLVRSGLAAMMESQPGCTPVGEAAAIEDLPAAAGLYHPEVVLVDPGIALENHARILDIDANLPVVFLLPGEVLSNIFTSSPVTGSMPAWLKHTGRAYLKRTANPAAIANTFRAIMAGLVVFDIDQANRESRIGDPDSFSEIGQEDGEDSSTALAEANSQVIEQLTPREFEVLALVAEGMPNKRIAQSLGISEHTVKFHLNAIIGKLGVESRTEAVTRAVRLGILRL